MTALPIPGYSDYTLTMSGIVRRNGKLVRTYPDRTGHARTVTLWKDGKRKMFMLHKLISQTFQVPEEDVKKALYEGFRMEPEARKRILSRLYEWQKDCEKDPFFYHDDLLYVKKWIRELDL